METGPSPDTRYPMAGIDRLVFLKTVVTNPNIRVGDYTYYDDPDDPTGFERNVLYHFDFIGDRLIIGRFCQIAAGATFVMNGGNHRTDGISTFPFAVFGQGWSDRFEGELAMPVKGDTVIGNDVWLGHDCMIMPGVTLGDGAIVATRAVVAGDVPPYAVVAGNPARVIRRRFDDAAIDRLLALKWWDWDIATITRAIPALAGADLDALEALAPGG
ncbi:MAG: CatB-related O-acetyltransferase [Azospirillaceae bacterium]